MGEIIFNGVSSRAVGIEVEHPPKYTIAQKEYTVTHIPGRNGDVVADTGTYKNVTGTYDIAFGSLTKIHSEMASAVSEWLCSPSGYCRLEDSYDPSCYRMGYFSSQLDLDNLLNHLGRATIEFTCMPQKFLKVGELPIYVDYKTNSRLASNNRVYSYFKNPTKFLAKPLIKITTGTVEADEESSTLQITTELDDHSSTVNFIRLSRAASNMTALVDFEKRQAYDPTWRNILQDYFDERSSTFESTFKGFGPGSNSLMYYMVHGSVSGYGIQSLEVTPRWWKI